MRDLTDRSYLRDEQYRDSRNLDARVRLHQLFSVIRGSLNRWLFERIPADPTSRVLELGCGPGHFWRETRDLRPRGWRVVCTDLSPGMVAEAGRELSGEAGLSFATVDAQALPFPDSSFDLVLANFMLYHVPDRPRALAEVRRVLRPGGLFAAATVGRRHMVGVRELIQRFVPDLSPEAIAQSDNFLLENGAEQLAQFFDEVRVERQPNALRVTEAGPLVDYVLSMWSYREALAGREAAFADFVADEIARDGVIQIAKETGLLLGRRRNRSPAERTGTLVAPAGAPRVDGHMLRPSASAAKSAALRDVTKERGWTPEALAEGVRAASALVWLDGDELTFCYQGAASRVRICCGIQMELHRIGEGEIWVLTVKQNDLTRAIVTYSFIPDERFPIGEPMQVWRGPLAPPALARATTLQGVVRTVPLQSVALGEAREVTVYLPPGQRPANSSPTVYAADGECVGGLAPLVEPLILAGALPPLLLVGAHSGEDELRAKEYLPRHDWTRFTAHERFFVDELAAWAERELGATTDRTLRAVFGFSNGGVFASEMALRHSERFGVALPFSAGVAPDTKRNRPASDIRVYLAAGLFEEGFYTTTRAFGLELERVGAQVVFNPRAAGHDYSMWEEEFAAAALWAFGM